MNDVMDLARGRWPSILATLGIPERYLQNKHSPCPVCNGRFANKKPYRFDDKYGNGNHYCTHHQAKDGMWLAIQYFRSSFKEIAAEIRKIYQGCPVSEVKKETKDVEKIKANISAIWKSAAAPRVVTDYLRSRGLTVTSPQLRGHGALRYINTETGEMTTESAMVALVQNAEGRVVTLHRTFLLGNGKREKKLYKVIPDSWLGGSIRLFPHEEKIGFIALAEGIETALAVNEAFNIPTWATVTADGMAQWEPPEFIKRVSIFADHDENFKGQSAAYLLANKLAIKGIIAEVHIPKAQGDYLDFLNSRPREAA